MSEQLPSHIYEYGLIVAGVIGLLIVSVRQHVSPASADEVMAEVVAAIVGTVFWPLVVFVVVAVGFLRGCHRLVGLVVEPFVDRRQPLDAGVQAAMRELDAELNGEADHE